MSKITRENILKEIDFENKLTGGEWTDWEVSYAMVAAYNLGVDAALEHLEVKKIDAWWKDNLRKKLKI